MREPTSFFFFSASAAEMAWQPLADIYRTREGWLIKMDLAGVRLQDISISRQGARLRVSGIRHDLFVADGCCHHSMEIPYCHFERTIELPGDIERAEIEAEHREGMLLLRVILRGEE